MILRICRERFPTKPYWQIVNFTELNTDIDFAAIAFEDIFAPDSSVKDRPDSVMISVDNEKKKENLSLKQEKVTGKTVKNTLKGDVRKLQQTDFIDDDKIKTVKLNSMNEQIETESKSTENILNKKTSHTEYTEITINEISQENTLTEHSYQTNMPKLRWRNGDIKKMRAEWKNYRAGYSQRMKRLEAEATKEKMKLEGALKLDLHYQKESRDDEAMFMPKTTSIKASPTIESNANNLHAEMCSEKIETSGESKTVVYDSERKHSSLRGWPHWKLANQIDENESCEQNTISNQSISHKNDKSLSFGNFSVRNSGNITENSAGKRVKKNRTRSFRSLALGKSLKPMSPTSPRKQKLNRRTLSLRNMSLKKSPRHLKTNSELQWPSNQIKKETLISSANTFETEVSETSGKAFENSVALINSKRGTSWKSRGELYSGGKIKEEDTGSKTSDVLPRNGKPTLVEQTERSVDKLAKENRKKSFGFKSNHEHDNRFSQNTVEINTEVKNINKFVSSSEKTEHITIVNHDINVSKNTNFGHSSPSERNVEIQLYSSEVVIRPEFTRLKARRLANLKKGRKDFYGFKLEMMKKKEQSRKNLDLELGTKGSNKSDSYPDNTQLVSKVEGDSQLKVGAEENVVGYFTESHSKINVSSKKVQTFKEDFSSKRLSNGLLQNSDEIVSGWT